MATPTALTYTTDTGTSRSPNRGGNSLTATESERINGTVSRLTSLVAFLLLAAWGPSQLSWALALLALADGSHHVSLRSSHGELDLVLHHHAIPSDADGATLDADDHPHGDHVIHGLGADRLLPSRLAQR